MGGVSAGIHVGSYAEDSDAALRQVFEVRANQQDGLSSILKFCQDESGFRPGDIDTTRFIQILSEFDAVFKPQLDLTTFVKYMTGANGPFDINDMVEHLPDNDRLLRFLNNTPSGNYDRAIVQFITELEGDFLTVYIVTIGMLKNDHETKEQVTIYGRSVDRNQMANRAEELVAKIREKERMEDWARGVSSPGYS